MNAPLKHVLFLTTLLMLAGSMAHAAINPAKVQKLLAGDGAAGDEFGASVAVSGDTAVIGAYHDDDKGSASGSAYVFVRAADGTWSQQAKLTADDGAIDDMFGSSVSLSADGSTALIGACRDDDKGTDSGSAYVFVKGADSSWSQQAKLTAEDGAADDWFGYWHISLSAVGGTALIGSYRAADADVKSNGSAYVFVKAVDGTWSQQAKLTANDGVERNWFGVSVSLSSDGGVALIGAPFDEFFTSGGSAYVFVKAVGGTWSQQAKLTADDSVMGDVFGVSVSLSADGSAALIGAFLDDDKGADSGSSYVFTQGVDGSWNQQAKLTANDGAADDGFGSSVSLSADGRTALIGAYSDDDKGADSGSSYVFVKAADSTWSQQAKLTADDGAIDDMFGSFVSLSADGRTALIGAYSDDDKGADSGSSYVFVKAADGTWSHQDKVNMAPIYKLLLKR
uniref:FG-GAP repeat protein n=1 Tax=Candidatus Electronema sp. TaxID=2698783 RepID=UPI004055E377